MNKTAILSFTNAPRATYLRSLFDHLSSAYKWLAQKRTQQLAARRMKVTETVSLGEKRFVSIIQVDGAQYLIGSAANSVSLLAVLGKNTAATEVSA